MTTLAITNHYRVTEHAKKRFKERFPKLSLNGELMTAKPFLTRRIRKQLAERCPQHADSWKRFDPQDRQYALKSANDVIFVIRAEDTGCHHIVTVLPLEPEA